MHGFRGLIKSNILEFTKLTFAYHVKDIEKKFSIAIKLLYPLINRKSELNRENKLILVKVIFQAILLYVCPAWGSWAKTHFKKLQVCQNKLFKMCLQLPWHYSTTILHEKAKVSLNKDRIESLTNKFVLKSNISDNNYKLSVHDC